jgi:hypothetical protein
MKKLLSTIKFTSLSSALGIFILLTIAPTFAQERQDSDNKADKNLKSSARVNPSTLAMELSIPLMVYPGRDGNSLPVSLSYSSKVWTLKNDPVADPVHTTGIVAGIGSQADPYQIFHITTFYPYFAERSVAGWSVNGLQSFPTDSDNRIFEFKEGGVTHLNFVDRVRVVLPDGSSHEFRKDDKIYHCAGYQTNDDCSATGFYGITGTYLSVDGSGMRLETGTPIGSIVYLPDGGRFVLTDNDNFVYIDRNGNKTFYERNSSDLINFTVTDTMGREMTSPLISSITAGTSPSFTLPGRDGAAPLSYSKEYQYLKPSGCVTGTESACDNAALEDPSDELYYIGNDTCEYTDLNTPISTPHLFEVFPPDNQYRSEGGGMETPGYYVDVSTQRICSPNVRFNPVVMTEVTMPDGSAYHFRYNRYGEMTKIVYPTGA